MNAPSRPVLLVGLAAAFGALALVNLVLGQWLPGLLWATCGVVLGVMARKEVRG